ncbi:MAG: 23S rRNA (adenine(2503)-C(2))-methyltransferase RlmN [Oscillospiraceae bacterium]|jgi:23S rRNA (adenine2503-C2)-methyltransferase|nr:23S rRNA (adenine(2503)-C(2))-methyltransferase RlmN [Oscillospiraceae bacterium]
MNNSADLTDILSLSPGELAREIAVLSERKFRAKQIFDWLHAKKIRDFGEISNISKQLRGELREKFCIKSLNIQKRLVSTADNTVKYLYALDGGDGVETVFMSRDRGNGLCVSTQVGCRMGCVFCASGQSGFKRDLVPSEMLLQLYETVRDGKTVDSLVLMGMGEPLDNFGNVIRFLEILKTGHGMGLRRVSLSTCGLVDKIDELARLKPGLTLSVSLHAANDADRSALMPINRRFGLDALLNSCAGYFKATGRRISYEYALIDGVNDGGENAAELARLLKRLPPGSCHVNLIPVNETAGPYKAPRPEKIRLFAGRLAKENINATVRRTLGADINAACGQLRRIWDFKK